MDSIEKTMSAEVGNKVELLSGFTGTIISKEECGDLPDTLQSTGGFKITVENENGNQSHTYINSVKRVIE